jgi:transcriptional regulator with XRE-family HTH domain
LTRQPAQDLRAFRQREGLKLRELAARLGCSTSTLGNIEVGRHRPNPALAERIESTCGVASAAWVAPHSAPRVIRVRDRARRPRGENAERFADAWAPTDRGDELERFSQLWAPTDAGERAEIVETLPFEEDDLTQHLIATHGSATLSEIGIYLGLTRERIRQIEWRALEKLRRTKSLHVLAPYLEAAA